MADGVGLSVGATNLTAVAVGRTAVTRSAVVTLFPNRPLEVGVPSENPRLSSGRAWPDHHRLRRPRRRSGGHRGVRRHHAPRRGATRRGACARCSMRSTNGRGAAGPRRRDPPGALASGRGGRAARCPAPGSPSSSGAALVSDATAALTALRDDPGVPSRRTDRAVRLRGQRDEHHAGRRRQRQSTDRPDRPAHRVVR